MASQEFLAIGLFDGTIHLTDLSDSSFAPFYTFSCGPKLIAGFSFSGQQLAVACFDHHVIVLTIMSKTQIGIQHLKGHTGGVTNVNWHPTNQNLLVSCGIDCTVRVWNVQEAKCEALAKFERDVFAAIFHPVESDLVLVGGRDFMMTVFNYKEEAIDYTRRTIKNGAKLQGVVMAVAKDPDVASKTKKEKRKNLEIQKRLEKSVDVEIKTENETQSVIQAVEALKLDENVTDDTSKTTTIPEPIKEKTVQFFSSSIFCLTPRELNRDPIGLLKTLVQSGGEQHSRHQQLFSADQEAVRALINEEHAHQIASNVESSGHLTLPMLTMDIKSVILEKISSKSLTEEYVAVAPFISHTFWRNTCLAYAHQCVEHGYVLKSISYFLCCYEENEAIAVLCQSNKFTEAMAIAKMRKSKDDPAFMEIAKKWTSYLEYCGNFEAAAIVWITFGNNELALKVLERRNNPSDELQEVFQALRGGGGCDLKQKGD